MIRCKLADLPWDELRSPAGKFHSYCRNVSLTLGGIRNTGLWGGGHPFDVQIRRIPPGAAACPYHSHLVQSELFVVQAGNGTVRASGESHPIKTGDVFYHPPGEPHQLTNPGSADLKVLIVADNPQLDACYYPDSDKWALRPGKIFRITECDYLDGEEKTLPGTPAYISTPGATPPAFVPFSQRKVSMDELPWENFDSPGKKFRGESKQLTEALGAKANTPTGLGGHPFDLELGRLPPGFSGCPFHSHAAQWEFYIFLSGQGEVRTIEGLSSVTSGDVVFHPPGELHQFRNVGTDFLHYFLIADNPALDVWRYPDSDKWGISSSRKIFRTTDTPYWEGEE